jgi:spectinomycin phosphotransferase
VVAASVEFLPVGDDSRAWSFAVVADDSTRWFLKVRRGAVDPATVLVPMFLRDHGLEQAVAAVPATEGDPWRSLDGFTLLVDPWVDGAPAMGRGLTDRQWVALGRFVAGLHRTMPPAALTATVAREPFVPWGAAPVRALDARLGQGRGWGGDPLSRELAGLWRAHRDELSFAADRAERLGRATLAYHRWEWVVQELADYGGRVLDDRLGEGDPAGRP